MAETSPFAVPFQSAVGMAAGSGVGVLYDSDDERRFEEGAPPLRDDERHRVAGVVRDAVPPTREEAEDGMGWLIGETARIAAGQSAGLSPDVSAGPAGRSGGGA